METQQQAAATAVSSRPDVWSAHFADASGRREWPCEALVRAVGSRRFPTVLEAGCGDGANLWFLSEHADKVVGVDANDAALNLAATRLARRSKKNVVLRAGDLLALPVADMSVDALVDVMAGQHVPWAEHLRMYREFRRVLRSGGWLFRYALSSATTRTGANRLGEATYDRLPELFPTVGPFALPTAAMELHALNAAGFKVGRPQRVRRTYATGSVADYLVMEARA